jgi:hypothetical protein
MKETIMENVSKKSFKDSYGKVRAGEKTYNDAKTDLNVAAAFSAKETRDDIDPLTVPHNKNELDFLRGERKEKIKATKTGFNNLPKNENYIPSVSELVAQIVAGDDSAKSTFTKIMSAKAIEAVETFEAETVE